VKGRLLDGRLIAADIPPMPKIALGLLVVALVGAGAMVRDPACAQGVAPGGPIGNSTGIGSGLGPSGGPGPNYPNGTGQPTLQRPPPPGGGTSPPPPALTPRMSTRQPSYPQPQSPFHATAERPPATVALSLPVAAADVGFLKGCWRSDTFTYEQHTATTTWCFDGGASGRFLYSRIDQPTYFCHGQAEAALDGGELRLHVLQPTCSDGAELKTGDLACSEGSDGAACNGKVEGGESWKVRLYRVR
jgi:hypothetical protein